MPSYVISSRVRGWSWPCAAARLKRGSVSTVLTSSYRVASHETSPKGSWTRLTGSSRRSAPYRGSMSIPGSSLNGYARTCWVAVILFSSGCAGRTTGALHTPK